MRSYEETTTRGSPRMTKQGAAFGSRRHDRRRGHGDDEWGASLKSKIITGDENRISRRFSASHAVSFREEEKRYSSSINNKSSSSRSNFTISSTVSSPGYNFKEEIDPSSYSFTTALRALQGRRWECMRGEGLALNSKWDEAEKYICNPLSGEVPVECLSAKTQLRGGGGRSFRSDRRRVSMSAPLFYPPKSHLQPPHHLLVGIIDKQPTCSIPIPERSRSNSTTPTLATCHLSSKTSSDNCSPAAPTPSIQESSIMMNLPIPTTHNSPPSSTAKVQSDEEKREEIRGESRKEEAAEITGGNVLGEKGKQETAAEAEELRRRRQGGCLSWKRFLWMRKRQRDKQKNKNSHCSRSIFLCPIHQW